MKRGVGPAKKSRPSNGRFRITVVSAGRAGNTRNVKVPLLTIIELANMDFLALRRVTFLASVTLQRDVSSRALRQNSLRQRRKIF